MLQLLEMTGSTVYIAADDLRKPLYSMCCIVSHISYKKLVPVGFDWCPSSADAADV